MKKLFLLLFVMFLSYSYGSSLLSGEKQKCLDSLDQYKSLYSDFQTYLRDCESAYSLGEQLCKKSEWKKKHSVLMEKAKQASTLCMDYTNKISSLNSQITNQINTYCDKKDEDSKQKCNFYKSQLDELSNLENEAWSFELYDTNGNDIIDNIDWIYPEECLDLESPCDYLFSNDSENSDFTIIQPSSHNVFRMPNGDLSLEVEINLGKEPSSIYATFTQKPYGSFRGIIYSAQLQKEGKNWWAQILLKKNEIYNGPASLDISIDFGSGEITKSLSLDILPYKNNSKVVVNSSKQNNSEVGKTVEDSPESPEYKEEISLSSYSRDLFRGVRSLGISSESVSTQEKLRKIAKSRKFKITVISTPYGNITEIERNSAKKGLLGYQEKKKIVSFSSKIIDKFMEKIKEKLGFSFGDKLSGYFAKKYVENKVYNDEDKIQKTKEDLGVDSTRAKLFNDVVDTDKRDLYKSIGDELPEDEVTKKAKEALNELEKFHDRAAASSLSFEYKTVVDTIKPYVKGLSKEELAKKKEVFRNLAAQNVEDYYGSVYRNGNRLVSNARFIEVIAKKNKEYDFRNPAERAKYYFDLLWKSGEIEKWSKE